MHVAALTQGRRTPAARFRVRQNIPALRERGIQVVEYCPQIDAYQGAPGANTNLPRFVRRPISGLWQGLKLGLRALDITRAAKCDIRWLQRELLPGRITFEPLLGPPTVFDVDDAIWLAPESTKAVAQIASRCAAVVAGNEYIAEWFRRSCSYVTVIPTGVDTDRFAPAASDERSRTTFNIGWIGTSSNLPYLAKIAPMLRPCFDRFREMGLLVMSDRRPSLPELPEHRVRFIKWSEVNEVACIRDMDVGIMPLDDTEWARGKCAYKMLQYMACGVPVIASPVGMNRQVLNMDEVGFGASTSDEWASALEFLYENPSAAKHLGMQGRAVVERNFSASVVSNQLAQLFSSLR